MRLLALALLGLIALPPAYVPPGERMLLAFHEQRERQQPLRIEAELSGTEHDWPTEVVFELHPALGYRVSDDQGGRWLIRAGGVVAGTQLPAPAWIPELELLVLNDEADLRAWFERAEVDLAVNELARQGEIDCFVIGGREGRSQVWVDKDRLEILRWVTSYGRSVEYHAWEKWDWGRFPSVVELREDDEPFALLAVHAVTRARRLKERDFTPRWVRSAQD